MTYAINASKDGQVTIHVVTTPSDALLKAAVLRGEGFGILIIDTVAREPVDEEYLATLIEAPQP